MLSVVIPIERSAACPLLKSALHELDAIAGLEVVCVGREEAHSRAARLNLGMRRSQGEIVLFHHPRSWVDTAGIQFLVELSKATDRQPCWGGFTHQFDRSHGVLKFTSWYSNRVRSRLWGVLYLDHCIFFDRRLWRADLPVVDIFEDTLLSYEFRKLARPLILPYKSTTSAIRFNQNGIYFQAALNQLMKLAFYLRIPHHQLNKIYERSLQLNSKYLRD